MELDDLKNSWEDVNNQVEKRQSLSNEMIERMTGITYHSTLKKITYPEVAGVFICIAGASFTLLHFSMLDTVFLQVTGIVTIVLLVTLSIISLLSLRQLSLTADVNKTYVETLKTFAVRKITFYKFQRINLMISYLLLVTIIILLPKFAGGKNILVSKNFWIFSFSFGYLFLLFYSKFVFRYYNKTLQQTEDFLKELAS